MLAVNWGTAMGLFKILANVAGFVLALAGVQIYLVNTRFLPRELQPQLWRKILLLCTSAFYAIISLTVLLDQWK
ncbi:MAG: hypothetical protein ACRD2L_22375 [Terriglobia bacterium]